MTVPNQRILEIRHLPIVPTFLQIENKYWMAAYKNLTRSAFGLYLYLAANRNGYCLEFSSQAVHNALGSAKSTICEAYRELEKKEYIVDNKFYSCGKLAWDAAQTLK